ncbi:MAG: RagB/SusD family nutrient uptake outer membrane protein [Bacteroides sp.]
MKRYIWLLSLAVATLTSCDLDMAPEDTMSPETYFKSSKQMELWCNGYYTQFDEAAAAIGTNADDNIDNLLGDVMMGQRSAADESGWNWTMLRKINYYFEYSKDCKDAAAKKQYDGVSHFMRAYFYWVKVRRYGDVPYYDQVIPDNDMSMLRKQRDDRGFVMDKIMEDLDEAIAMLPTKKDIAHVTKWTALAIKSRIALFEGTYRKYRGMADADKFLALATEAAQNFIDNSGYKLYTTGAEPYRDLFSSIDAKSDEVVLARIYSVTANVMHSAQFNISNDRQGFSKRFINHYLMADGSFYSSQADYATKGYVEEMKDRDPRLAQTVLCPGYIQVGASKVTANSLNALTGYQPIKFVNAAAYDGSNKSYTDFPLVRAAEVYLNYAEAKAELGTLTQTDLDKSINKIRTRAKMPALSMSFANANIDPLMDEYYPNVNNGNNKGVILEIRRERTIELAMEGFRIWDIIRWKEGQQLTKPFYGCYFPGAGEYDMDGDGTNDLLLYTDNKGSFKGTAKKIGKDVILTNGTSGYIHAIPTITVIWDEGRDYLWPIPASERVLSGGALSQNPGWTDSTNYN